MKKFSPIFLFCALMLMLLLTACAAEGETATPLGTIPGGDLTVSPPVFDETETPGAGETETPLSAEATATVDLTGTVAVTDTAQVAETGTPDAGDVILLECQFCIEGMGHALLVFPETSTFEMAAQKRPLT